MNIGQAVAALKEGRSVARSGWNGKGMSLTLVEPWNSRNATVPYVLMDTATDDSVPWLCSQTDLLAEDWMVLG